MSRQDLTDEGIKHAKALDYPSFLRIKIEGFMTGLLIHVTSWSAGLPAKIRMSYSKPGVQTRKELNPVSFRAWFLPVKEWEPKLEN